MASRVLEGNGVIKGGMAAGESLFLQLAGILREKVYSKEWCYWTKIPSEHDLMRLYDLSRGTVRRAIRMLVDEGILVQHHGKGTFVAEPGISHAAGVRPLSFAESLRMQGKPFVTHVIDKRVVGAPADVAIELGLKPGDGVMFLRRVRTVDEEPVICQESWTNLRECSGIDGVDFTETSLFDAVQQYSGRRIKSSVMRYQALVVGKEHGDLLGCDESAAVLMLEQNIRLEDGVSIEWSNTWLKPGQSIVGTAYQPI